MVRTVGAAPEPGVEAYQGGDIQAALGLWRSQTEAEETDAARAAALYLLGAAYADPATDPFDETEAVRLWERAALLGDGLAMAALTRAYVEGRGVETNPETARCWAMPAVRTWYSYVQFEAAFAQPRSRRHIRTVLIHEAARTGHIPAMRFIVWTKPSRYTDFDEVWYLALLAEFGDHEKAGWLSDLLEGESGQRQDIIEAMIASAPKWRPDVEDPERRFAVTDQVPCPTISNQ
jgi:hypothetical protein